MQTEIMLSGSNNPQISLSDAMNQWQNSSAELKEIEQNLQNTMNLATDAADLLIGGKISQEEFEQRMENLSKASDRWNQATDIEQEYATNLWFLINHDRVSAHELSSLLKEVKGKEELTMLAAKIQKELKAARYQ